MKKTIFALLALAFTACNNGNLDSKLDGKLDGVYVGYEELCTIDSSGKKSCYGDEDDPSRKWFHRSYLKIRGDSAFMDQNPISIYKNDTSFSASDGAFYYYRGTVRRIRDSIVVYFDNKTCHYCGIPYKLNKDGSKTRIIEHKTLKGTERDSGIIINGLLYKKIATDKRLLSEDWRILE
jgi:hypothetical protein